MSIKLSGAKALNYSYFRLMGCRQNFKLRLNKAILKISHTSTNIMLDKLTLVDVCDVTKWT